MATNVWILMGRTRSDLPVGSQSNSATDGVGRVTEVRVSSLSGQPRALIVETGLFHRRSVEVPIVDVASVMPAKRRVALWYPGIAGEAGQGSTVCLPPTGGAGER
jgi:hypothetical protein